MIPFPFQTGQLGASQAAGSAPATDPYWANVVALLNMGGANGSTAFPDSTGLNSWTAVAATVDTSLGYNAAAFPSTSRIGAPSSAGFAMGAGDFTVEAWVRIASTSGDKSIFTVALPNCLSFGFNAGKPFAGPNSVSYGIVAPSAVSINVMHHIEYSRASGTGRMFVDGVEVANGSDAYNYSQSVAYLGAGSNNAGSTFTGYLGPNGFIQAFRLTKGVARHTTSSSFTPPAAPFPTS